MAFCTSFLVLVSWSYCYEHLFLNDTVFELCSVSGTLSQVSHTGYWIRCWETHSLLLGM